MTPPDQMTLQRLAEAHSFRLDALTANRAGYMTDAQARDLRQERRGSFLLFAVIIAVLLVFGVWELESGGEYLGYGLLSLAVVPVLGFFLVRSIRRWRQGGRAVAVVESFLRLKSDTSGDGPDIYTYTTNDGLTFKTTRQGFELIDPGQRYRVYYSPGSNEMVNIEPVDGTFSISPPPSGRSGATPFPALPYLLSEAEVSAIIGIPVRLEQRESQTDLKVFPMPTLRFSNPALQVVVFFGFRLGGQNERGTKMLDTMIRQKGERVPYLGDEAYYHQLQLYVYRGDVLLIVAVIVGQPGHIGLDRQRARALAEAL